MTNDNYEILLENIEKLMRNKNINQATLIRETGIPQPQMSKSLNRSRKNQFTFEQIWSIADYFNVSIDYLVGRKNDTTKNEKLSNKEICKVLMQLIESETVSYTDVPINEKMFVEDYEPGDGYPYMYQVGDNTYRMLYFANYYDPKLDGVPDVIASDIWTDLQISGNANLKSQEINDFLTYYFKLYDLFKNNDLDREIFNQAISDRLDKLEK